MQKNELNSQQIREILLYVAGNNVNLAKQGKLPVALEIEGPPGTAKTSVAKQVSAELDAYYVRLNLAEIEPCDLVGLPIYEYEIKKGKDTIWVTDKVLAGFITMGYDATGHNRTNYSKPSWIQGREDKPIILVLDDYNRTTPMMTNAAMTIIDEQRYISWGLPLGSTVILTCNPSDEDFFVQAEDKAQATRRLKVHMKADVNIWASDFAEPYGVDSRCINFMLKHPEVIEGTSKDSSHLAKGNLRIWTKFFDTISGIGDFSKNLSMIMNLGMGSLPQEHVILFTQFIKNGLDKLASPEELLKNKIEWSIKELKGVIKEGNDARKDIASIITKRLLNYALAHEADFTKEMTINYAEMMESGLLSPDLVVLSLKKICTRPKFKDIAIREKTMKILTS